MPQRICWRRCWAHPRSCGENNDGFSSPNIVTGSSPLMRGKRRVWRCLPNDVGLIPAHAGKTCLRFRTRWRMRAHPRSCGENDEKPTLPAPPTGSSPLMRGKQHGDYDARIRSRLIPAHAGKTRPMPSGTRAPRAHPRSCGENALARTWAASVGGSSPLMRGKPGFRSAFRSRPGLIPAHAGKTTSSSSAFSLTRAHPRSRGENPSMPGGTNVDEGSSPLMQGKRGVLLRALSGPGFIPAHAGKTRRGYRPSRGCRAHPRSRGENVPVSAGSAWRFGSSPLMRGKLACFGRADAVPGLIPAHTGKTCGM